MSADLYKAVVAYVTHCGVQHDDDCSEDDTCECEHVQAINRALGAACPHGPGFRSLEDEVVHLRHLRDQLQGRMTEMVEASRYRRVRSFMMMAGQETPPSPCVPPEHIVRMRLRLVAEEFFELLDSALGEWKPEPWVVRDAHERVTKLIDVAPVDVDLPEFVDALVDLDYVIEGARVACGVYGEPVEAAVHHANMEKGEGPLRADGKKEKPPGWKPPDVAALLRAQGWQHPRQGSSLPSLDDMPLPPVPGPEAP